jgi:hypothetical protein
VLGVLGVLGWAAGCAQLVGIEDTDVAAGGSAAGVGQGGSSGSGNSAGAGQSGTGGGEAGVGGQTGGGGTAGTGGTATGGAGTGATAGAAGLAGAAGSCGVECLPGPVMVEGAGFYIDSTEITVRQYREFVMAKGDDVSGQPPGCEWNTTYAAGIVSPYLDQPVTYVDWCDAHAYCEWAGKRLCGAIDGGVLAMADLHAVARNQWYLACASAQGLEEPYGSFHIDARCNDGTAEVYDLVDVATYPGCMGSFEGLYDMVGNVLEWVDSCNGTTGAADLCAAMGGSYVVQSYCTSSSEDIERNTQAPALGFRCCKD